MQKKATVFLSFLSFIFLNLLYSCSGSVNINNSDDQLQTEVNELLEIGKNAYESGILRNPSGIGYFYPPEIEPCMVDITQNGFVDLADLTALSSQYYLEDQNGDNLVNCLDVRMAFPDDPYVSCIDFYIDGIFDATDLAVFYRNFLADDHRIPPDVDCYSDPYDYDGLNIYNEASNHTNPINYDTDGDGHSDGEEVAYGSDPLDPASFPQYDPDDPSITNVSGQITEGSTITLTGQNFGAPPVVFMFDDFEQDDVGDYVVGSSPTRSDYGWLWEGANPGSTAYERIRVVNDRVANGTKAARVVLDDSQWAGMNYFKIWPGNGVVFPEIFLSFYSQIHSEGEPGHSEGPQAMKLWRVHGEGAMQGGSYEANLPDFMLANQWDGVWGLGGNHDTGWSLDRWNDYHDENGNPINPRNTGDHPFTWASFQDTWSRHEIYMKMENPNTADNGELLFIHDFEHMYHSTDVSFSATAWGDSQWDEIKFGNDHTGWDRFTFLATYWDDVYIASKMSRIELGDDQNFYDCEKRDLQIADSWDNGTITFNLRSPSFESGETAYLFVINEEGEYSTGYQVTIE